MFKKSIASRVMAEFKKMIDAEQKKCDQEIISLEKKFEQDKIETENKHVNAILNKFTNHQ